MALLRGENGGRKAPAQAETLQLIGQVGKIAAPELCEYFPGARSALVQLKKRGMFALSM